MDYIFLATYGEEVGLFAAPSLRQARERALSGLSYVVDNPNLIELFVRPATEKDLMDIDSATGFIPDGELWTCIAEQEQNLVYYFAFERLRYIDQRLNEGSIHLRDCHGNLIADLGELLVSIEAGRWPVVRIFTEWFFENKDRLPDACRELGIEPPEPGPRLFNRIREAVVPIFEKRAKNERS